MATQVTLTEAEVRAFSSLLSRVSERLATYEEQTHQDRRYAEELQATADDLLNRLDQDSRAGSM
jgi:cell shape-determining protein MreC